MYRQMKEHDKAIMAVGETLAINVLNAQAYYMQGLIYLDQGLTQKGCEALRKAVIYDLKGEERADAIQKAKEICEMELD